MQNRFQLLRLLLALCLSVASSCASAPNGGPTRAEPQTVLTRALPESRLLLSFAPLPPIPWSRSLTPGEARAVLAAFHRDFPLADTARLRRLVASAGSVGAAESSPAPWELQLRKEFLSRYGPSPLPLPSSLEDSPLVLALQLSPKYMGPGFRDAAEEMFRSPTFLASVALSVTVYLAAWALPEPVFSKAFATALTVRLALAVGLLGDKASGMTPEHGT